VPAQKAPCFFLGSPVAGHRRELAHHQALDVRAGSLIVLRVGAVVADVRVSEDDDLAGVGRIGEDFLVTGDGRVENDLAGSLHSRTKTGALEDRSVFQGEDRFAQSRNPPAERAVSFIEPSRDLPLQPVEYTVRGYDAA
jgi:hypothetical protein